MITNISFLSSQMLDLFDQKYSTTVKYYYNFKEMLYFNIFKKKKIFMWYQSWIVSSHYSSLQCDPSETILICWIVA